MKSLAALFFFFLHAALAADPNRLAILVGNDAYKITPLSNAVGDARRVAASLGALGFRTRFEANLDLKAFSKLIDFIEQSVNENTVLFFYYAGHGIQLSGENYLVPIDFDANSVADATFAAYPFTRLLAKIEARKPKAQIYVLDACRNNPFRRARGPSSGLAPVAESVGVIVSFATGEGRTAADSGVFATELVKSLRKQNRDIRDVFREVKESVYLKSGKTQIPYIYDGLIGPFSLGSVARDLIVEPDPNQSPAAPPTPASAVQDLRHSQRLLNAQSRLSGLLSSFASLERSLNADGLSPRPSLVEAKDSARAFDARLREVAQMGWSGTNLELLDLFEAAVEAFAIQLFGKNRK